MDTLIQGAMQLGVIPVLALFLVFRLNTQQSRLTDIIDSQRQEITSLLGVMVKDLIATKAGIEQKAAGDENND